MTTHTAKPVYLVSACLVGLCTRYDGRTKENLECCNTLKNAICIPVCPEQLGGLPTPREAADIAGGNGADVLVGKARVLSRSGIDLSENFIRGAKQILQIARSQHIDGVFLKARSPSCGVAGTVGVTAALLQAEGFQLTEF